MTPEGKIREWREHPIVFVKEVFGAEPDSWQANVLEAFPTHQRIAVKSGKGPGKTCLLSWLCWNFLATRPDPKIIATSITGDNLFDNLWPEMSKWQSKSEFLKTAFVWNKTRIFAKDHPETWFMSGRTWSQGSDQQKQANTLAGTHADYVMYVLDEVGGIPDAVSATAEGGLASGIETKLLMAGNPTHLEGPLYRACTTQRHLYFVQEITGDPSDPNRSTRVSSQWAQEQIDSFGADNPWVLVNVFGKFPPASINVLLGPDEVQAAMQRVVLRGDYDFQQKRLGIDVALQGDDRSVLFPRQGLQAFAPIELRNERGPAVAARAQLGRTKWKWETCFIDDSGGYGAAVQDAMRQGDIPYVPISFAGKADDPRYLNKRAEMWFRMAEWVKRGGALPNIPALVRELTTPTYTLKNGKFQLEDKLQIKKRLGFSPDLADALALTFAWPEMPSETMEGVALRNKMVSDFDPYNDREKQEVDRLTEVMAMDERAMR